jgi:gluconolactonase
MYRLIAFIFLPLFFCSCRDQWYGNTGVVEGSTIATVVANGFVWSEGPVWVDKTNTLLISDVPANIIYQWSKEKGQQVYLRHAGFADTLDHRGSDGSNGLAVDRQGSLIICQSGARRVVRMKAAVDAPAPEYEVVAENYNGKKFNSPNDVVVDGNNTIYFTDPVYGLPGKDKDPGRELNYEGVFRIAANGIVSLLIDSISKPNGITLSPDEKILYISSSDEKKPGWYAYRLSDSGTIVTGGMILDALPLREKALVKQSPDGLKTDNEGTIYSTGPEGVSIISPGGTLLGLIKVKDRSTSNVAFNTKKDSLYITADDIVLQIGNAELKSTSKKQ